MAKIKLIRGREADVTPWFAVVLGEITDADSQALIKFCTGETPAIAIDAVHELSVEPNW